MKIIREDVITGVIEQFAYVYCLTMSIRKVWVARGEKTYIKYYASFKDVSVETNSGTAFTQGLGDTEKEAISNYARMIKLHRLKTTTGKYIHVWDLI